MRSSILLFASGLTTVLAVPAPQASGTLGLGAQCTSSSDCANGADCYSTNSGLIRQCGNFQASCSSDSQCAYNTCVNGLCNGFKATTTASSAAATGTPTTVYIPVGQQCSPNSTPCANGSSCYSTNSGLITICGNFQAECQNDSQCAFNTCKGGLCNGFLSSTSSAATPTTSTQATSTTSSAESTSTATSLALGANCTPGSTPCADGATCYAVNSGLQPRCGNFQASCTTDAQCAFNTCNKGLCNGYLASSGSSSVAPVTSSDATATTPGDATPAASTAVVVTTPVVTESSVVVVGASATSASGSSSSTATSSAAAVLNTNAASSSKSGPLGLAFAGAVAIAALI